MGYVKGEGRYPGVVVFFAFFDNVIVIHFQCEMVIACWRVARNSIQELRTVKIVTGVPYGVVGDVVCTP
jgi:hypothetical protein